VFHSIVSCILSYFDRLERHGRDKRSSFFCLERRRKKKFFKIGWLMSPLLSKDSLRFERIELHPSRGKAAAFAYIF